MRNFTIIASLFALTACGAMNQKNESNKPVVTEEAAKAQSATLPAVTIVRVPVGADGKEVHANAEMRLADQSNLSKDNVAAAFNTAKAPASTIDELDGASSTESYHGYRSSGRYYNSHRHHGGYNWNWNFYRPTYYYYGYYYNWNYSNTYNCGGYNYYQYNYNNSCGNSCYIGYGNAPGYGYSY